MIADAKTRIVNRALYRLGCEPIADLSAASLSSSIAAVKLLRVIDEARDEVLGRHGWTCALEYVQLSPATIAGYVAPSRYPWVYLLPDTALRVWTIQKIQRQWWEPKWQAGTTEVDGSTRHIIRGGHEALLQSIDGVAWGGPDGYFFGDGWSEAPSSCESIPIVGVPTPTPTPCGPWTGPRLEVAYVRRAAWDALDAQVRTATADKLAALSCYSVTGDNARTASLDKAAEASIATAIAAEAGQEGGQDPLAPSIPAALRGYSRI